MDRDLVIGLDSSTQSAKAIAWSRTGELVAEGRAEFSLRHPQPGYAEQLSADWWSAACNALSDLMRQVDPARISALSISNQRETIAFFDAKDVEIHPAITWLDDRSLEEIPLLTAEFGSDRLHNITGRPPNDATVAVHSLSWMRRHKPDVWERTAHFYDVHAFLTGKLTGTPIASTTSIDAFTVFNIDKMQLSRSILGHLGLSDTHFAEIRRPGTRAGTVFAAAASATGLPEGLPIIVGGGDGQCASLGVDAIAPGSAYLNLGTAIIAGIPSKSPWISKYWRTVTSPLGEGYLLEGCQRAGTFLIDWLTRDIGGKPANKDTFTALEAEAARLPVGSDGVTMSPYLMGCMDPNWDRDARASIHGLSPDHSFVHVFRAALEATALQIARYLRAAEAEGMHPDRLIAVGGGASNKLWTGMIADASGLPIIHCISPEASSLGAGITAAVGVGWYDTFTEASASMVQLGGRIEPDPSKRAEWDALSEMQSRSYTPG